MSQQRKAWADMLDTDERFANAEQNLKEIEALIKRISKPKSSSRGLPEHGMWLPDDPSVTQVEPLSPLVQTDRFA